MDLNKVMLGGNLTRDPESRYTPGGSQVVQFGMAINRRYQTRDGENQEETCFVDVEVWGGQAEACAKYLHKGDPVLVEGRLRFDSWEDRDSGRQRSRLTVTGERVQFLSRMAEGGDDSGRGGGGGYDRNDRGGRRDDSRGGRGNDRGGRRDDRGGRRRDDRDSRRRDDSRGGRRDDDAPTGDGARRGDSRRGARDTSRGASAQGSFRQDDDSVDDIPF